MRSLNRSLNRFASTNSTSPLLEDAHQLSELLQTSIEPVELPQRELAAFPTVVDDREQFGLSSLSIQGPHVRNKK